MFGFGLIGLALIVVVVVLPGLERREARSLRLTLASERPGAALEVGVDGGPLRPHRLSPSGELLALLPAAEVPGARLELRSPDGGDRLLLLVYAIFENIGYRQLTVYWRLRGLVRYARGRNDWGTMTRRGFETAAATGPAAAASQS